jgi:hypothetical protein
MLAFSFGQRLRLRPPHSRSTGKRGAAIIGSIPRGSGRKDRRCALLIAAIELSIGRACPLPRIRLPEGGTWDIAGIQRQGEACHKPGDNQQYSVCCKPPCTASEHLFSLDETRGLPPCSIPSEQTELSTAAFRTVSSRFMSSMYPTCTMYLEVLLATIEALKALRVCLLALGEHGPTRRASDFATMSFPRCH